MKQIPFFLQVLFAFFIIIQLPVYGHGFGASTMVRTTGGGCRIEQICRSLLEEENFYIASYDVHKNFLVKNQVKSAGESETNCYVRLGIDEWLDDDVICTPTQEFYLPWIKKWIPAYQLRVGDELLSACKVCRPIKHIEFVKKPLAVYSIEVEYTHTFLVGRHSILTHNMLLPALTAGLSIPFGAGVAAGATTGCFFGPATFAAGMIVGGLFGIAVKKLAYSDAIPRYTIWFNSNEIEKQFKNNNKSNNQKPNSEDPNKNKKSQSNKNLNQSQDNRESKELLREVRSLNKQLTEHQIKLKEYIQNPDKFDNKGLLRNSKTPEQRTNIINGRISHLNKEIKTFQTGINKAIKILQERQIKWN